MHPMEITWLCIVIALISGFLGYGIGSYLFEKCEHKFEEVLKTSTNGGRNTVVAHMCKKCGKRKITKV